MDLSLSRIRSLISLLPRFTRPTVHIAGTNGKGSTTAIVDSILRQAGFSTGRFNSPHLVAVRDPILLDGQPISEDDYQEVLQSVKTANQLGACQCTNFEIQTVIALLAFERAGVDVAILEVGLGGRLDATNVIPDDVILVSGITAIDLDHQAILGDTPALIATQKAGIARRGRPCILGRQSHPSAVDAVTKAVDSVGGRLIHSSELVQVVASPPPSPTSTSSKVPPSVAWIDVELDGVSISCPFGLHGGHQLSNAELVIAIIVTLNRTPGFRQITPQQIARGLSLVSWPGRLEWIEYREALERKESLWILVDGAHNPACAASLAAYLSSLPRLKSRTFIISLSKAPSKSPRDILKALLLPGDRVAVVPFSRVDGMPWVEPQEPTTVLEVVKDLVGSSGEAVVEKDIKTALGWARNDEGFVIVTGSLYLVADLYRYLLSVPPKRVSAK
ncbi:folylpolyglutamate synthase [Tulasnella sp. 427]|nr:folylpolyglutamate synthase [Tulasnella sp. 427]